MAMLMFLLGLTLVTSGAAMNEIPIVFIHGVKGSELRGPDRSLKWLTLWQVAGLSTPNLALPLRWSPDGHQDLDDLQPSQPLTAIPVFPGLYQAEIYGPFLKAAARFGAPFYPFAYDWRRDNLETLQKFQVFIENIRQRHGGVPVQVVAHSMGGLITLALVNSHPEYFAKIYFAGVPFTGGIGFFPDIHEGVATGFNRRILAPPVIGTFPSVYSFFALDGHGVVDEQGQALKVDFYSLADWRQQRWGFFRTRATAEQETFLSQALEQAKKFRHLLEPRTHRYPAITAIVGDQHPTLAEIQRQGTDWRADSRPEVPGDGRVCATEAILPAKIPHEIFHTQSAHAQILNDPKVQERIFSR